MPRARAARSSGSMQYLNPRHARVVALPQPSEREKGQWYFQRYIERLPTTGEIVLMDRSWYNRAGVERVMGYCTDEEYERFLQQVPIVEKMLVDDGIILIKYWFSVSDKEQQNRFKSRLERSDAAVEALADRPASRSPRWEDYSRAKDAMFEATDTAESPWWTIDSDDKRAARLNMISHLLSRIPYEHLSPRRSPSPSVPTRPTTSGPPQESARQHFVARHRSTSCPQARSRGAATTIAAVVYNPIKVELDALAASSTAEAQRHRAGRCGCRPEDDPGQGATDGARMRRLADLAAGGDGTVRAVAEVVRGQGRLARAAAVGHRQPARPQPRSHARRHRALARDRVHGRRPEIDGAIEIRREDGSVDKHAFLVMAGIGLDAKIMANTDQELKKKVGWLAYVSARRRAARQDVLRPVQARLGPPRSERAQPIVIGNCGSLPANILLLPDAGVDDGLLDVSSPPPETMLAGCRSSSRWPGRTAILRRTRVGRRACGPTSTRSNTKGASSPPRSVGRDDRTGRRRIRRDRRDPYVDRARGSHHPGSCG